MVFRCTCPESYQGTLCIIKYFYYALCTLQLVNLFTFFCLLIAQYFQVLFAMRGQTIQLLALTL